MNLTAYAVKIFLFLKSAHQLLSSTRFGCFTYPQGRQNKGLPGVLLLPTCSGTKPNDNAIRPKALLHHTDDENKQVLNLLKPH